MTIGASIAARDADRRAPDDVRTFLRRLDALALAEGEEAPPPRLEEALREVRMALLEADVNFPPTGRPSGKGLPCRVGAVGRITAIGIQQSNAKSLFWMK